jgi:hypothetical protein
MSKLQLNDEIIPFKEFYGPNHAQMATLVEEGRVSLSIAGLMRVRLDALKGSSEDVKNAWWNNYFDTGDGILYRPDGDIKVVLSDPIFRNMTAERPPYNGALILGDSDISQDAYTSAEGVELKRNDLSDLVEKVLPKEVVKSHPVWNALVPNTLLLHEYVDAVFELSKSQNNMGIWLPSPEDKVLGRLWCIDNHSDGSNAIGVNYLKYNYGRLVGVAPEALSAREGTVPNA